MTNRIKIEVRIPKPDIYILDKIAIERTMMTGSEHSRASVIREAVKLYILKHAQRFRREREEEADADSP